MKKRIYKLTSIILVLLLLSSCIQRISKDASSVLDTRSTSSKVERKWVLGKAYIPENNPEPVLVNREDAATPTPISFTDKIVKNKMDLDVKRAENVGPLKDEDRDSIAILNSYDEFAVTWEKDEKEDYDFAKEYHEKHPDTTQFDENEYYINWYTEEFFKDNTLVVLFLTYSSGSYNYKIEYVAQDNGRMYIYINNSDVSRGTCVTCDMAYYRTFISVPKNEMAKIKDIVVYKDELYVD